VVKRLSPWWKLMGRQIMFVGYRSLQWSMLFVICVWGMAGACTGEGSVCGTCKDGFTCDTAQKKCVKVACLSCESSIECDNDEVCLDGCCTRKSKVGELPDHETPSKESTQSESGKEDVGAVDAGEGSQPEALSETTPESSTPDSSVPESSTPESSTPDVPSISCTSDVDCSFPVPYCDLIKQKCVQCRRPGDCLSNQNCDEGLCVTKQNLCEAVSCPPGEDCNPNNGNCVLKSACSGFCKKGQVCDINKKVCVDDCRVKACKDANETCNQGTGVCMPPDCRTGFVCTGGLVCDNVTGQCVQPPPDCRKAGNSCKTGECCHPSTGKCVTDCRICKNCKSTQTCNSSTGICQTKVCQVKSTCKSSADCCGLSCKSTTLGLGTKRCRCSSSSQCGTLSCKTNLFNKYCR